MDNDLPFIDEHQILISAPALAVWRCLTKQVTRLGAGGALAQVLKAEPRRASGGPVVEGTTTPGFKVAEALPEQHIRLTGQHRFSRYALTFTLAAQPGGTMLSARSEAVFPGLSGSIYRQLVIGSGAHRLVVARMLRSIRDEAQIP